MTATAPTAARWRAPDVPGIPGVVWSAATAVRRLAPYRRRPARRFGPAVLNCGASRHKVLNTVDHGGLSPM